jgi:prepilin-type N-terminal cleavage/methylation domain-containing protein
MAHQPNAKYPPRGFTLLELSIVIALIGVILSGSLVTFSAYMQSNQYNTTVARMDAIEQALLNFTVVNGRLPCPADITLTPCLASGNPTTCSANYGLEAGAGSGSSPGVGTGVCTGGSIAPAANFTGSGGQVEGGLPTRALQLPDSYTFDGWCRRFS